MMQTMTRKFITSGLFILGLTACFNVLAEEQMNNAQEPMHKMFTPNAIQWNKGPESLPKGAKVALLEGDPGKEGPYTLRLKVPANYRVPPHSHPGIEHVTVISGNFYLGMGDQFDKKLAKQLPPGSFAFMQPATHHFAFTSTPTIIQLHGIGPWGITYVNPQDDPRHAKTN